MKQLFNPLGQNRSSAVPIEQEIRTILLYVACTHVLLAKRKMDADLNKKRFSLSVYEHKQIENKVASRVMSEVITLL